MNAKLEEEFLRWKMTAYCEDVGVQPIRSGSAMDTERMVKLFTQLDFETFQWLNLTKVVSSNKLEKARFVGS